VAVEAVRDVEDRDVSRRVSSVSALAAAAAKGSLLAVPGAEVERWGYEIEVPPGFDYSLVDETTERQLSEWIGLGLCLDRDHTIIETRKTAVLVLPTGARGLPFSSCRTSG
jgi:membrane-bound lytic murein transglycosylase B